MKYKNILKVAQAILAAAVVLSSCAKKEFEEITQLSLARCMEPQKLQAKVDVTTGDFVTFSWTVNKDADAYELVVYTDEALTEEKDSWELEPTQVPFTTRLTADEQYWFTVQAYKVDAEGAKIESSLSKVAVYDGHVSTYAVKDNLFLEVTGRTASSISLSWSNEIEDYTEVTHISARPVKGGEEVKLDLSAAQATAAAATVEGLEASTEYQLVLFYMSTSRGAVDVWTAAQPGTMTQVSTSEELVSNVAAGGEIYLTMAGSPYTLGTAKPAGSVKIVGEMDGSGNKPVIVGAFEVSSTVAEGSSIYCENIKFDDQAGHNHLVNYTGGATTLGDVKFVNCEITAFKAGLFYNNKTGAGDLLTVGDIVFDSCDIYNMAAAMAGDCLDFRKNTHAAIQSIQVVNCTIYDGIRTFLRLGDQAEDSANITCGQIVIENNTIKNVSTISNSNNRGIFAIRIPTNMSLKRNVFLYEDTPDAEGKGGDGKWLEYCHLFQDNSLTVVPTLAAQDNFSFAHGDAFFAVVSATAAGFTELNADPCYNSKGNFFQLANTDVIAANAGASKWWIPYVEKEEDLTQHALEGPHTWNLQDASLFAGEVKNSRVRDELLLVGTEATPLKADGGISFLSASVLSKKGQPTEGYLSFKVNTAGSVDMLVAAGGASSVVVSVFDESGYAVKGGVMTPNNSEVQKVLIPKVTGEATVYIYATGAISLKKLAWSEDVLAGNRILATPKPVIEPVTLTEGDASAITVTWEAVDAAASYEVIFNKKAQPAQTELSFTVAAEDVAALKSGLYNVSVQALPREDDIYYLASEPGTASFAIQPKGGDAPVEVTLTWDFSDPAWVTAFGSNFTKINNNETPATFGLDGLDIVAGGGSIKYNATEGVYFIQTGGAGSATKRAFQFDAPAAGTVKVWASQTGDTADLTRLVAVALDGTQLDAQPGGYAKKDGPHELEFEVTGAGRVAVYSVGNGLCFYKFEFTYTTGGAAVVEYDWNFSDTAWVTAFGSNFTKINTNETPATFGVDGLDIVAGGGSIKYNATEGVYFIQTGGAGSATKRAFQFDAPAAGTVKVWASQTGDTADLTRLVAVALDGTQLDAQPGGYAKKDGPHELEFEVTGAGRVAVYSVGNGLCFYHIYYINQ